MSNEKKETIDAILKKYGSKHALPDDPIYQAGYLISLGEPGPKNILTPQSESPNETPTNAPPEQEMSTRLRLALEEGRKHAETGLPWYVSIGGSQTTPPAKPSMPSPPETSPPTTPPEPPRRPPRQKLDLSWHRSLIRLAVRDLWPSFTGLKGYLRRAKEDGHDWRKLYREEAAKRPPGWPPLPSEDLLDPDSPSE